MRVLARLSVCALVLGIMYGCGLSGVTLTEYATCEDGKIEFGKFVQAPTWQEINSREELRVSDSGSTCTLFVSETRTRRREGVTETNLFGVVKDVAIAAIGYLVGASL